MKSELNSSYDCWNKDVQDQHLFTSILGGTLNKQRSMAIQIVNCQVADQHLIF